MLSLLLLLSLSASSAAPSDDYEEYAEYDETPEGYHVESQIRRGLVIPGSIMFGVSYGLSILAAILAEEGVLAIPIVGPAIIAVRDRDDLGFSGAFLFGVGSAVQIAGVMMTIFGIVFKREILVEDTFAISPLFIGDGAGASVAARF